MKAVVIKQIKFILFLGIFSPYAAINCQDLVFGVNPVLLKGGRNKLGTDFFYVEDGDKLNSLGAAPTLRVGITDAWEWRLVVPLVKVKNKNPLTGERVLTQGVADIITTIKYQPYAYRDPSIGKVTLFTLLAGLEIPGNFPGASPIALAGQVVDPNLIIPDTTTTGTACPFEFGDQKVSFLLGASTLLITRPWGILSSILIGLERINECGNREGNFFIYSLGIGKELANTSFWNVFGLIELDWIYESSAIVNFKKVPCTSNHIIWIGPNLIILQATRELKFGIQTPLDELNRKRDYRLFLGFEWEF